MAVPFRYPVTKNYIIARGQSLAAPFDRFSKFLKDKDHVFGVVVDMPVAPRVIATLVAYANGAGNVYFNTGAEYVGAARKYLQVVKAAQMLVYQGSKMLPTAEKATDADMPTEAVYNVNLLTRNGTYHFTYKPKELKEDDEAGRMFAYLCTNLMKELHEAQMLDKA